VIARIIKKIAVEKLRTHQTWPDCWSKRLFWLKIFKGQRKMVCRGLRALAVRVLSRMKRNTEEIPKLKKPVMR